MVSENRPLKLTQYNPKHFENALFLIFSLFIQLALNVRVTFYYILVPSGFIMKKMTGMSLIVMATESSECHLLINRGNLKNLWRGQNGDRQTSSG